MGKISSYKAKVEMELVKEDNSTIEIPMQSITSIILDYDFETKIMPVIYVTMRITTDVFNEVLDCKDTAKIYLQVKVYDTNASIALNKTRLKGQFIYFTPSSNYDYREILQNNNPNVDNSYNNVTIGLMSAEIINYNGVAFNGIYRNTTTTNLLKFILGNRPIVMDPIDKETTLTSFFFPPKKNRLLALKYLYDELEFYNKNYIYFHDFDTSYLLKRHNRKVINAGNTINTIIFNANKINVADAYYQGVELDSSAKAYVIYLNGTNIDYKENDVISKVATDVVITDVDGLVNNATLNVSKNKYITSKKIYVKSDTANSVPDNLEASSLIVNIVKNNLDSSIFTPDKIYKVSNSNKDYKKFNGNYSIVYKKEVVAKVDNEYILTLTLGLRRLQ